MRELTQNELSVVAAGELTCTAGTSGINCSGTPQDWANAIGSLYDAAVSAFADALCSASGKC